MSEVIYTSHALIVDEANNLYLENNPRVEAISMWGGKREWDETPLQTIARELSEEVGIGFRKEDLMEVGTDSGEVVQWNEFISTLFLVRANKKVVATILNNPNAFKTTLEALRENPGPFVIEKSNFIARIEEALSHK